MSARRLSLLRAVLTWSAAVMSASVAHAGITIHYEGTTASPEAAARILAAVAAFAKENKWKVADASAASGKLEREINEKMTVYLGKITGVVIHVNDDCEPINFQFDQNLFLHDSVKTQFAGADIHVKIIELLESLRPLFTKLDVDDEGEYWEAHDRKALDDHLAEVELLIADARKNHPELRSPFREHTGRIADVAK